MGQDILYIDGQGSEIGDMLRESREAQHISIRGAARRLKIREKYLYALEQENFSTLPQGAYLLGFLRNYALFLGLNYRDLRDLYYRKYGKETSQENVSPAAKSNGSSFILTPGRVIGFVVVVLSVLLLWYLLVQYQRLMEAPVLEVFAPREGEIFHGKNIKILGITEPDALLFVNGEEAALSNNGEFSLEYVVLENGLESLEITAQNRINDKQTNIRRTFTVDLPSSEVITVNELGEVIKEENGEENEDGLSLRLRTMDQVWFNIVLDNDDAEEFIMEKGEVKIIKADTKIYVHCGKAYATYYSLNNDLEKLLGDTSVIKKTWEESDLK